MPNSMAAITIQTWPVGSVNDRSTASLTSYAVDAEYISQTGCLLQSDGSTSRQSQSCNSVTKVEVTSI